MVCVAGFDVLNRIGISGTLARSEIILPSLISIIRVAFLATLDHVSPDDGMTFSIQLTQNTHDFNTAILIQCTCWLIGEITSPPFINARQLNVVADHQKLAWSMM